MAGRRRVPLRDALHAPTSTSPASRPTCSRFVAERDRQHRAAPRSCAPGNSGDLAQWTWGRQAVDVVAELARACRPRTGSACCARLAAAAVLDLVEPARRRRPGRADRLRRPLRAPRARAAAGVCSTFLADARARHARARVRAAPRRTSARRPPRRARDHGRPGHRASRRSSASSPTAPRAGHTGRNWLFFGEQRQATDFYYRDELSGCAREGTLDRLDLGVLPRPADQGLRAGPDARARRPAVGVARRRARTSTCAATPSAWRRTSTRRCTRSSRPTAG